MSWLGSVIAVLCLYLAFKVVGFFFKLLLMALMIGALVWFAAPYMGWTLPL